MRSFVVALFALLLTGCGAMKWYQLPLTPHEGMQMVPALIAASQEFGLYSFRGNGALTELEDGSQLSWESSADGLDFVLYVTIPSGVPADERAEYFAAARARADQIWARAAAMRGQALGFQPPPATLQ